ncbi:DUF928 domain-containing protein [Phormidium sp. CLA17]|uniref:DUF928 domain-containing protein n=1 Tax=Leptolyngbya sp. Cla-17 TaxID=2803751 RepID=UPI0014915954|nr:DUF928 domain-containing protein [Leptolyngbya sp. Cla-17]MBM0744408.1 DUF928 domain-containing protein [Leptolyngbya sp. Cla-17]
MASSKTLLYCLPVGIALTLEVAMQIGVIAPSIASPTQFQLSSASQSTIQLAQSNPPPPPKNPGRSSPGGRRNPSNCPQDAEAPSSPLLTALSPATKPGFTLAERPTFLVYVPKTSAKNAEFSLRSRGGRGIYRTTVALTNTPNLITLTLPAQAPPLTVEQPYTWLFAIICSPSDRLDDRFVTGMVQRIEFDSARLRQIQQAPPKEQVALYQKANAWYDTLAVLYQLKRSQLNDPSISTAWRELLQSGGVDTLIDSNLEKENLR